MKMTISIVYPMSNSDEADYMSSFYILFGPYVR